MACHTWVYKKVSAFTDEEKKNFGEKAVKQIESWWGFKKTTEEIIEEVKIWYKRQPEVFSDSISPEDYALDLIKEFTEKRDAIRKAPFENWVKIHKNDYPTCFNHNGEIWVNIAFDDPFRVCDYPEWTTSGKGFVDGKHILGFLQDLNQQIIGYYDDNYFVRGYSNELEKRIKEFLNKHGEENIMFDFG